MLKTALSEKEELLSEFRRLMKDNGLDAYIIPSTDPHLGEYVPEHWKVIKWLTGFTGSAATVVITGNFAGLWTDSRYFIQATEQLYGSGFELVKLKIPHTPEYITWLSDNLKEEAKAGVNGSVISIGLVRKMEESFKSKGIDLLTDIDLVEELWTARPELSSAMAFDFLTEFAGKGRSEKIVEVREQMKLMNVQYHLLTAPDDIMWLLNIRGSDVDYSPLLTSFAIIDMEQILLFADEEKIPFFVRSEFDKLGIVILPYEETPYIIESLDDTDSILLTPGTTSASLYKSLPAGMNVIEDISIPSRQKAVKNSVEIENIKNVMVSDGVALTNFFYWLCNTVGKEPVSEISASEKLLEFRKEQKNFLSPSFATIAAYNAHGALPHYTSTPETDSELKNEGIFLLDSGGQYLGGTTDITRSVSLGKPTKQQKSDFTLALKGTINLAMAKFPSGTRGYQLDILARKALWDNCMNYGHGTGHGVGFCLSVHEGPQSISPVASPDLKTLIEKGMVISDEPAIYREGEYGFRTENLILCVDDKVTQWGQFLRFETLSLCYIDKTLIEKPLLTDQEVIWLNDYHKTVYEKLSPFLDKDVMDWLKGRTDSV